jgi:site-specific recombinase XerD
MRSKISQTIKQWRAFYARFGLSEPNGLPRHRTDEPVLLAEPKPDIVIGLRDRALLALLCGSGIRANEMRAS